MSADFRRHVVRALGAIVDDVGMARSANAQSTRDGIAAMIICIIWMCGGGPGAVGCTEVTLPPRS
jgi:hypothetical protein